MSTYESRVILIYNNKRNYDLWTVPVKLNAFASDIDCKLLLMLFIVQGEVSRFNLSFFLGFTVDLSIIYYHNVLLCRRLVFFPFR